MFQTKITSQAAAKIHISGIAAKNVAVVSMGIRIGPSGTISPTWIALKNFIV